MYINNDYNDDNDNKEMTREQYQKTQRILGIILVTVIVLLVLLIVGKKLNIIDKADRIKPYPTKVTIESSNVIDKFSAEVGNEIILNMEFSEELKEKPTVVINNTPIKVGQDGNKYFAKYHVEEQYYRDKEVEFKIENYRDKAKNIGERVTLTTDNSKVVIRAQNTIITPVEVESIKIETPKKVLNVNETVVEIGPGKCVLSDVIAKRSKHLTCIELDKNLEPYLNVLMEKHENVDVIYGNALEVYIPECDKILSALPYSITEPFIEKIIMNIHKIFPSNGL